MKVILYFNVIVHYEVLLTFHNDHFEIRFLKSVGSLKETNVFNIWTRAASYKTRIDQDNG